MSLIGANYMQFKVPVYQRTYDWQAKHCEKLVKDIFDAMSHGKEHFTGSIVYFNAINFSQEKVSLIIDGQQRITTVIIILKALADLADYLEHDQLKKQIEDKYLSTDTSDFKRVHKLIPTEEDEEQFALFMQKKSNEMDGGSGFAKNYRIIHSLLQRKLKTTDDLARFYKTLIHQMTIVELVLDKGIDDPQEIFESINSTGLELTQADLIRNYLLMSESEQDHLYKSYWKPLFKLLGKEKIEAFMFDYLMYKTERKIRYDEIYNVFTESFIALNQSKEQVLEELLGLGKIYHAFIEDSSLFNHDISELLHAFRYLEQTTIYPFLFKIFIDYQNGIVDGDEIRKILRFFLNYHIKRIVVGSSSASFRGLYINLYNRIFKLQKNKERYYDSIATFMGELKTKDEVPSDLQFMKNLQSIEIYKQRKLVKYLLATIENYDSNEHLVTEKLTVEHIMPQVLQSAWIRMLGSDFERIHEEHLHTLGNLSITGYNSTMGNKSFPEKKRTLIEKSKANSLNSDVIDKDIWSKDEIKARSKRLAESILKIFRVPKYSKRGLRFERVEEHDFNYEYEDLKGKSLYSFRFIDMDREIRIDSYRGMLIRVIEELDGIDSKLMDDVAASLFLPRDKGEHDRLVNEHNLDPTKRQTKIRDGLYLSGYLKLQGTIASIKKLMYIFGIDEAKFLFYTKIS